MRGTAILLIIYCLIGCTASESNHTTHILKSSSDTSSTCHWHIVNPDHGNLRLYWADSTAQNFQTFPQLDKHPNRKGHSLRFAMNGRMFIKNFSPQGLYVEDGKTLRYLNTKKSDYGNFYMQPNGIFYINKTYEAGVCKTTEYNSKNIAFATQSGPMLLIDGQKHPRFKQGSSNLHIRNGVGILPNGNVLFAISKKRINFFDFAQFFEDRGCKSALYLDGFVSRMYLPEKNIKQMDGRFGVLIAELK